MVIIAGTSSLTSTDAITSGVQPHNDASQAEICRPFCKRVYRVDRVRICRDRARVPSGAVRPGPVLVDIPMDSFRPTWT